MAVSLFAGHLHGAHRGSHTRSYNRAGLSNNLFNSPFGRNHGGQGFENIFGGLMQMMFAFLGSMLMQFMGQMFGQMPGGANQNPFAFPPFGAQGHNPNGFMRAAYHPHGRESFPSHSGHDTHGHSPTDLGRLPNGSPHSPGGRMTASNFSLRNFKPHELTSGDGTELNLDANAAHKLDALADWYKEEFGERLRVVSGHRSHSHNRRVGGARHSQHVHGRAFDLATGHLSRADRLKVIAAASRLGFKGIGVYSNNIHIDTGGRRAWGPDFSHRSIPRWARSIIAQHMSAAV